jgi:hypothetical protein
MRGGQELKWPLWMRDGRVLDWWDQPIQYRPDEHPRFRSFGPDGRQGGEGTDSDIVSSLSSSDLALRRPTWSQLFRRRDHGGAVAALLYAPAVGAFLTFVALFGRSGGGITYIPPNYDRVFWELAKGSTPL